MRLVSRKVFGRAIGAHDTTLMRAGMPGGSLAPACHGTRIDIDHPAAHAYCQRRGVDLGALNLGGIGSKAPAQDPTDPAKPRRGRQPKSTTVQNSTDAGKTEPTTPRRGPSNLVDADDLAELHDALSPLVERFGTSVAFKDYLNALKTIVDIREKDLKNEDARGRFVSRELVESHIFGYIDALHKQLLTDSAQTIAQRVHADAKSGRTVRESTRTAHDIISTRLKHLVVKAKRALSDG